MERSARRGDPVAWQPYIAASLLLAITAGFGLGGVLMIAEAHHAADGPWWEAAAQAHGHVQVFGWAGLMVLGGLALRVAGDLAGISLADGVGRLVLAAALLLSLLALSVFGRRRPLPREPAPPADPIRFQMVSAYLCLAVVMVLLILEAIDVLGVTAIPVGPDAERHPLGAGFVTLLILGVGAFLLPSMTGRRRLNWGLLWATGACANAAAVLRVAPVVAPGLLPGTNAAAAMAVSGLLGLAALVIFALNVVIGRSPAPAAARRHA